MFAFSCTCTYRNTLCARLADALARLEDAKTHQKPCYFQNGMSWVRIVTALSKRCKNVLAALTDTHISNSYTMGCPPVRGDNPRALASGLSYVQADNPSYNFFIPPTSV